MGRVTEHGLVGGSYWGNWMVQENILGCFTKSQVAHFPQVSCATAAPYVALIIHYFSDCPASDGFWQLHGAGSSCLRSEFSGLGLRTDAEHDHDLVQRHLPPPEDGAECWGRPGTGRR